MKFTDNSSAGVARTRNYARSLDLINTRVIFASFLEFDECAVLRKDLKSENIFYFGNPNPKKGAKYKSQKKAIFSYLRKLSQLIDKDNFSSFLLYPSSYITFDMAVLLYLKMIKKRRVYYELNEVRKFSVSSLDSFFNFNYIKHSLNEKLLGFYDGLICISTNIEKYYASKNSNIIRVPILSDVDSYDKLNLSYDPETVFKIGFTGFISIEKENLVTFLDALSKVKKHGYKFEFNLYGTVSESEMNRLLKLILNRNLNENVVYHGKLNQNEIPSVLKKQNLLVLPRRENRQNKYGFSTKLSEYLVSGSPVLITNVSDNLFYLKKDTDVIVAIAEDENDFVFQIERIINCYNSDANALAYNAFMVAKKHFDFKMYSNMLDEFLFVDSI